MCERQPCIEATPKEMGPRRSTAFESTAPPLLSTAVIGLDKYGPRATPSPERSAPRRSSPRPSSMDASCTITIATSAPARELSARDSTSVAATKPPHVRTGRSIQPEVWKPKRAHAISNLFKATGKRHLQ